jgi:hypothetical protein
VPAYLMPIQSRLAAIPADELARIKDGTGRWLVRVYVRRRGATEWVNLSEVAGADWVTELSVRGATPDSPVTQFTINLIRQSDGRSVAPGMTQDPFNQVSGTFNPLIHPDDDVQAYFANLAKTAPDSTAVWRKVLVGELQNDAWPDNDVVITCNSLDHVIEDTEIEEEEARGAPDPGTPLSQEAQGLINRWKDDPVTVWAPDGDGIGIGPYKPAVGKLGRQIRDLAGRQAWSANYVWDNGTGDYRYAVYDPPRDKTTPDLYLAPDQVREIPGLEESNENIRNDFVYVFIDSSGRKVTRTYRTVYPAGGPTYRRRPMRIVDTEIVKTAAAADLILQHASHDLSRPLAQKRVRIHFNPYLSLHDVIQFSADDQRFDISTIWSVVGVSHTLNATDKFTDVDLRAGGPVGQYELWRVRASAVPDTDPTLRNLSGFLKEDLATGQRWTWTAGPHVHIKRAAVGTYDLPEKPADWDNLMGSLAVLQPNELFIPYPPEGQYAIAHVESYDSDLRKGVPWRRVVLGTPPEVREKSITVPESADGTTATVHAEMIDPRGVLTGCNVYLQNPEEAETGPFTATLVAPLTWEYTYALPQDHGVYVKLVFPRSDGGEPYIWGPALSDNNKIPGAPVVTQVWDGADVQLRVDGVDTDTAALFYQQVIEGVPGAETPIPPRDGGTNPRYGAFPVTAGDTELRYFIYGKNSADEGGPAGGYPYKDERVAVYIPLGDYGGPSLDVRAVASSSSYQIYWTGDSVTLSINGGAYAAPPESPITVARPAAGAAPLDYTFRAERNGVPLTNLVSVVPIDADTVTPDLTVTPTTANTNNATQGFTASASNPRTSEALPVTVRLTGCSGTNNGVALPADTDQTVAGAIVVTRPAFGSGNGTATFTAQIAGGGREVIQRGIIPVQRDTLSPSVTVTPGTPTATTMTVSWAVDAGTSIVVNAVGASLSFTSGDATSDTGTVVATRPAAGSAPGLLQFTVTRDDITLPNTLSIPPVGADTVTPDLTVVPGAADNFTATYTASATNPRTGATLASVTATLTGVTGYGAGGTPTYADGAVVTMTPSSVLTVVRPPFGSPAGTVTFKATIVSEGEIYGASETIPRTIPASQQMGGAVRAIPSETATQGTLTVEPVSGAPVTAVHFRTKSGTNEWTAWAADTAPYVATVDLVEKHPSQIGFRAYNGSIIIQEDVVPFDLGRVADVTFTVAEDKEGTATVTVNVDTDTLIGAGGIEWRVDAGLWNPEDVTTSRTATFDVAQTGAPQALQVRGFNADAVAGPVQDGVIPPYFPPATVLSAISLAVEDTGGSTAPSAGDDIYTANITGSAMAGKTMEVKYYRSGALRHTQTFTASDNYLQETSWTDVGQGDATSNPHSAIVTLYDSTYDYGSKTSRTVNSFVS